MDTCIIHPPSQLKRDVDKKTSGGLKRRVALSHRTTVLSPLQLSESLEDIDEGAGCRSPELFYWKRDFGQFFGTATATAKPPKNTTTYVEWKKAPKKRKKKKSGDGSFNETPSLHYHDELALVSSRIRSTKDDRKHDPNHQSRKENSSPSAHFKPSFSHSRYSNLQKFRSLSCHEKQKMSASPSRPSKKDSLSDLAAIKQDIADLKRRATNKNTKSKGKKVQFAHPLISQLKYRPKTRPEEIDALFFREDELLDWEEDRETTSPEFVELVITDDDGPESSFQFRDIA